MEKLHHWILDHDDRWSFILLYVGAAIMLSIFFSLFWVAMLMVGHFVIELWRHIAMHNKHPVLQALWCIKLDIALVLFSLVVALYADVVMGALGLGQAARAGAMSGAKLATRFAILERALKVFFLTVDDFARVAQLGYRHIKDRKAMPEDLPPILPDEAPAHEAAVTEGGLSGGDLFALGFGLLCAGLIIAAPSIIGISLHDVLGIIGRELHP